MNAPKPSPKVLATPQVWMEGRALEQLTQVAHSPGCCCAVGMPDLHPGRGIPIGGFTMLASNLELRWNVVSKLFLVGFFGILSPLWRSF